MTDPRAALEEAFKVIHPEPPKGNPLAPMWYWKVWADDDARFRRFLDAEAWIDAALMLVPGGWDSISIRRTDDGLWHVQLAGNDMRLIAEDTDEFYAEAEDFVELWASLAAACIKAKEAGDGRCAP